MQGWRVAGFTELSELGAGAQGRVVLARHDTSGGVYAIKYVFAPGPGFRAEARLLTQVDSPFVARLFDFVEEPGAGAAMVMEAVPGVPLRELLAARGAQSAEASLAILKGSLLGLAAAHAVQIVHRDYKPANVIVPGSGPSKLIDFGIAKPVGAASRSGTPAYMAPEQWHGAPAGPSTDVYAATCVFFECVTGRRPYQGGDTDTLMSLHTAAPIPVTAAPEAVRSLIANGMAKDPAARPAGAAEFVTELERVAVAGFGPDWENRGWRRLAEAASMLLAASPVVAALLQAGISVASAMTAGSTAAGTAGVASGSGVAAGSGSAGAAGLGSAGTAGAAANSTASGATIATGAGAGSSGVGAGAGVSGAGVGSGVVAKVAAGVAAVVVAGGVGAAVAVHQAGAKPHGPRVTRSATPQPSAVLAAVNTCTDLNGGRFGTGTARGTVPRTVNVPAVVKMPQGATVSGVAFNAGDSPLYVIAQSAQSCGYSIGADGGTTVTVGPANGYNVEAVYDAGGVGVVQDYACHTFGDIVPNLASKFRLRPSCAADPATIAGRQVLRTGAPNFYVALLKNKPTSVPSGPYVSVILQTLSTGQNPQTQSITCTMPTNEADICRATLTYFLVQSLTGSNAPQAALAQDIAGYVAANQT